MSLIINNFFGGTVNAKPRTMSLLPFLRNRYSFNGNANDSVGGKNGTSNNMTYNSNGAVFNGSNGYITLPTGTMNGMTSYTIEFWTNVNSSVGIWGRVYDFGSGTTNYMFFCPITYYGLSNLPRWAITTTGTEQFSQPDMLFTTNSLRYVAITYNASTTTLNIIEGPSTGTVGVRSTNTAITLTPSSLGNTTNTWIGRSQQARDSYFMGSVREFRIWTRALTLSECQSNNNNGYTTVV